jgi:prepilin-type N-terminal cleavage/methylation domain-containing protein
MNQISPEMPPLDTPLATLARSRAPARRGFTLTESAIVTVIIGVGAVAMLELLACGTASNVAGADVTTGINLAKQVRELTLQNTFEDLICLDGQTYDPPRDASNDSISKLAGWKQTVTIKTVNPDKLTQELPDADPEAIRVTVTVSHGGREVCAASWHRFR